MKLPSKVRIKARVSYEILWIDQFDDPDCMGLCRFDTKQITLKKDMSLQETLETFIHELFHAIEFEYGIKIPHKSIYSMEGAVLKILKLNGWLPTKRK
jgi:hypothetical protein